jgi:hypothetical protein
VPVSQMVWTQHDPAASAALGCLMPATMGPGSYPLDQLMVSQPQMQQPQVQLTSIFFAGVTPIVDTQQLLGVFAQFGRVMDLNLFRPYKGCRTSKVRTGWLGRSSATHRPLGIHDKSLFDRTLPHSMVAQAPRPLLSCITLLQVMLDLHAGC